MPKIDCRKYITQDPKVRNGEPCIRGLPITVLEIVAEIIGGATPTQMKAMYPQVSREDILACLIFAAQQPKPLFILQEKDLWPNTALKSMPASVLDR